MLEGRHFIFAFALLSTLCCAPAGVEGEGIAGNEAAAHGLRHPAVSIHFPALACNNSHSDGVLRLDTRLRGLLPNFDYTICVFLDRINGIEEKLGHICVPFSPADAIAKAVPGMIIVCR
jgi:hypothetical protein